MTVCLGSFCISGRVLRRSLLDTTNSRRSIRSLVGNYTSERTYRPIIVSIICVQVY